MLLLLPQMTRNFSTVVHAPGTLPGLQYPLLFPKGENGWYPEEGSALNFRWSSVPYLMVGGSAQRRYLKDSSSLRMPVQCPQLSFVYHDKDRLGRIIICPLLAGYYSHRSVNRWCEELLQVSRSHSSLERSGWLAHFLKLEGQNSALLGVKDSLRWLFLRPVVPSQLVWRKASTLFATSTPYSPTHTLVTVKLSHFSGRRRLSMLCVAFGIQHHTKLLSLVALWTYATSSSKTSNFCWCIQMDGMPPLSFQTCWSDLSQISYWGGIIANR